LTIEKCSQWDAAYCEVKLAEAVKYGKTLNRRFYKGKMGYVIASIGRRPHKEGKEGDGYDAEFNCDYFDYPPFLFNLFHSTPTVSIQRAVMLHVMYTM
jgi:hypothetical protein